MSSFACFRKKAEEPAVKEVKMKTASPFDVAFGILKSLRRLKSPDEVDTVLKETLISFGDPKDLGFIANIVLKYSVYNKECLAHNEELVKVFSGFSPLMFIKYFMKFCAERSIRFSDFLKYYNCGLMSGSTRYDKFFHDMLDDHDYEVLNLILAANDLTKKELFSLVKSGKIDLMEND